MTVRCPKGHDSDEPDYCSLCGAQIASANAGAPAAAARAAATNLSRSTAAGEACPSCGEPRADTDARFCEVCRFDFVARQSGPPPVAKAAVAAAGAAPQAASMGARPAPFVATSRAWDLVVAIDPSLDTEPDPASPCPLGTADVIVQVEQAELLVGRRDDRRDIKPEIPLNDPGASRRHAKIVRNADGSLALLDLAATNGTRLNGEDMPAGGRKSLREGDAILIGRWTRITVRGRP
jgi:hypothetical protein